jgi:hypothetical protein
MERPCEWELDFSSGVILIGLVSNMRESSADTLLVVIFEGRRFGDSGSIICGIC